MFSKELRHFNILQHRDFLIVFEISIFLASSSSFNVKNDNIHSFFFAVLVANFEVAGFAPKQKYTDWIVSVETVRTAKS